MADIEAVKLLYHLTDIKNLESILANGLKPRSELAGFTDVADPEILENRKKLKLEDQVPFHFFGRNPFDGGVQVANPDKNFVLITVTRALAGNNNWKVIPRHPLVYWSRYFHTLGIRMSSKINWLRLFVIALFECVRLYAIRLQ